MMDSTWWVGVPINPPAVTRKTKTLPIAATTRKSINEQRTKRDAASDVIDTVRTVNVTETGIVIGKTITRRTARVRKKFA